MTVFFQKKRKTKANQVAILAQRGSCRRPDAPAPSVLCIQRRRATETRGDGDRKNKKESDKKLHKSRLQRTSFSKVLHRTKNWD